MAYGNSTSAYGILDITEVPVKLGTYGSKESPAVSCSRNVTYYYRLKTKYPEFLSDFSASYSKRLPSGAKTLSRVFNLVGYTTIYAQYMGYCSSMDPAYFYTLSNRLYTVVPGENCIRIYPVDNSLRKGKGRTIKLKYEHWGGFYNGTDGYFYVVVGYSNLKDSSKKTAIKVIKYNHKWQQVKTANIHGGVTNTFKGIHIPFAVNTKTMKAVTTEDSYVSHSFNQYVKYDNDNLYLLDHGDG